MTNAHRGEVSLVIDGMERTLCLTLGALAEIETALGASGFAALADRLKTLSAGDLAAVLAALLRGGGEADAARTLVAAQLDFAEAARAVADAFERAL
ncbi:GTA-gp10 family protein [Hyphobacterium marinum]|uniref:GTA-gp10 family protein n=1 Tax=Hyphobacterium marinum TaxID=3116574 RepID=A0ABU7M0H8_9PROT|nr:GTA-gp10 family protein [Hyphobacterium sp. Y6023]MEE2567327.1 GTA-gp10 family protein [Hyphobacterium sp. Y6023]